MKSNYLGHEMTKFKAGDKVRLRRDDPRIYDTCWADYLVLDKIYTVGCVGFYGIVLVDVPNEWASWAFELMEEKKMNKIEAQKKIDTMKKELAELERIVNAPNPPQFKPFELKIETAQKAYYLFELLGKQTGSGASGLIYGELVNILGAQVGEQYYFEILGWLKNQIN